MLSSFLKFIFVFFISKKYFNLKKKDNQETLGKSIQNFEDINNFLLYFHWGLKKRKHLKMPPKFYLKSNDNQIFEVDRSVIRLSTTLNTMIQGVQIKIAIYRKYIICPSFFLI